MERKYIYDDSITARIKAVAPFAGVPMAAGASEPLPVLLVDDDPDHLDLTATFLTREADRIEPTTVTSAKAGLERLGEAAVECIVSDYQMPDLDGLEFLTTIREADTRLPFILFTGKGSEEIAGEAIRAGVTDYLQKGGPETYRLLANRIETCVARARAERALRNSEEKYRALVEQSLVGIYLYEDDQITYVNPRFAEIFGYEPAEVVGLTAVDLTHEGDEALVRENVRRRLDGEEETIQYAFTGVRKDGEPVEVEVQGRRIDLDGEPAIAGVLLDRSRRRDA